LGFKKLAMLPEECDNDEQPVNKAEMGAVLIRRNRMFRHKETNVENNVL
jgi:hypothetical protein